MHGDSPQIFSKLAHSAVHLAPSVGSTSPGLAIQVKIICNLRHSDASPLAKVCTQMREAVEEAIDWHFNVTTPLPRKGHARPAAPRHSKRFKPDPNSSLGPLGGEPQAARCTFSLTLESRCLCMIPCHFMRIQRGGAEIYWSSTVRKVSLTTCEVMMITPAQAILTVSSSLRHA